MLELPMKMNADIKKLFEENIYSYTYVTVAAFSMCSLTSLLPLPLYNVYLQKYSIVHW